MRNVLAMIDCGIRVFFTLGAIAANAWWLATLADDAPKWLYPVLLMVLGGLLVQLTKHLTNLQSLHDNVTPMSDCTLLLEVLIENMNDDAKENLAKTLSDELSPGERENIARQVEQKLLLLTAINHG